MFDNIAPAYDMLNHMLSLGLDRIWRRRVVGMVRRKDPAMVVDVATGTGDLALSIARHSRASVRGVDLSSAMIEVGRRKVAGAGLDTRITFTEGDAECLPLPDCCADCVTAAFGVRNFQDLNAGLRQMHRVLRPGGSCFVLEFSTPRGAVFGPLFRFYFHRILPVAGGLISGDMKAYRYLPASVDEFPGRETFEGMMRDAGFGRVSSVSLMSGVAYIYIGERC